MLWRDLKAWQVYGANTDVGKTILSTILCKALTQRAPTNGLLYLKPVSTGPQQEADDRHIKRYVKGVVSKCISQFADPVSPHLAAKNFSGSKKVLRDDQDILLKVKDALNHHLARGGRYAVLETAGGVLSPGPSGTVQADLYRPLRLPTLLVGDSKLGGIGTTISAFESLHVRGYDVESVLLFDDPKWGNHGFLQEYLSKYNVQAYSLPSPPTRRENEADDQAALSEYYEQCLSHPSIGHLTSLLHQNHFARISKLTSMASHADSVIWHPFRQHQLPQNIIAIDSACGDHFEAYNPEMDEALNVSQSPSANGLTPLAAQQPQPSLLTPLFDASASWWTQGLGHGNPELSLAAAYAAGRYGHVMFASAVHEPALDLSFNLLATLQNPRLNRVFFTDNGSTGMEVAVKMALRATCQRYGWSKDDAKQPIGIIGLKGSYHGDTIGVMNCSEPSTFNEKVDWYRPWGYWFDPPEVRMKQGQWQITLPSSMLKGFSSESTLSSESWATPQKYSSLSSIFDFNSRQQDAAFYQSFITHTLTGLTKEQRLRFGALIIEPIIMGAGGMIFVDPLFQRTLITTIRENPDLIAPDHDHDKLISSSLPSVNINSSSNKDDPTNWSGLPFIADEVFTGLYRLGRPSSSSFLNHSPRNSSVSAATSVLTAKSTARSSQPLNLDISPDISVHAKLLTGGLLPLALTTASSSIFETFLSDFKTDALLHGHSYTAHPIGCTVANKSLDTLRKLCDESKEWDRHRQQWQPSSSSHSTDSSTTDSTTPFTDTKEGNDDNNTTTITPFSFFSPETLIEISHHPRIESCFALGTVLALTLKSSSSSSSLSSSSSSSSAPPPPPPPTTGYNSNTASTLQSTLLTTLDSDTGAGIHSRVLGDVIYFMTSLTTTRENVQRLERSILTALESDPQEENDG